MTGGNGNDWSGIITWAILFLGWFVVHKVTLIRERRKEKRETAKQFCTDLRELEIAALDFHTADNRNGRKATDLRQQVERVILQLQRKPLSQLNVPLSRMVVLRQRITRNNMDPSDFGSKLADDLFIYEIRNAITDLIASVEDEREKLWP